MVLREHNDPLNQSKGIMGPLENSTGVQNNRGRLRQRFDLIRKLGQGTYGKVQLGIDKETGQEVAIKTIKKSKIETEADLIRIRREIQIMSSVRHPNIIHIYEVFENREKMVLVMEYAAGGELYDYLNDRKVLKEDEARRIFRQIASAVYYCHKNKICHRDLKLENILLDEATNAKIADFGLSNVFDSAHLLKTFCGSPLYASPEIVRGTPYCGPEVDCWSLGVLLYTLVYGAMPFDGSNFKRLVKQISNGDYYEPKKTAEASPLIKLMLTVDALKRATIKDVCSNVWLNQGFDQACLEIAEELANATPVRLDILLSLSTPINTSNVVIQKHEAEGPAGECSKSEAVKTKTKGKKSSGTPKEDLEQPSTSKPKTPSAVKKQVVKKKSKSSPLLELIVDVEEENEHDVGEEGTLSEISEIQTIAEGESDEKIKPRVCQSKEGADKIVEIKSSSKKAEPKSSLPENTQIDKSEVKASAGVKVEASTEQDDKPGPGKVKPQVVKTVPKKKVSKPNEQSDTKPSTAETPSESPQTKAVESKREKSKTPVRIVETVDTTKLEQPKVESDKSALQKTQAESSTPILEEKKIDKNIDKVPENKNLVNNVKCQKEASPPKNTQAQKAAKLKQRSDSTNSENTSPTRIERRNSKVISQKTAELIQNLETKTSTTQDGAKGKKFVFPSLKVSDAKSRFETSDSNAGKVNSPKVGTLDKTQGPFADKEKKQNSTANELKPKIKLKSVSPSPDKSTPGSVIGQAEAPAPKVSPDIIKPINLLKNQKEVSSSAGTTAQGATAAAGTAELQTPAQPKLNETAEPNIAMKVEALTGGTKSPRASRSPRRTEQEKNVTANEPSKKVVPVESDAKDSNKDLPTQKIAKPATNLKLTMPGDAEQIKKSVDANDPSAMKPIPPKPLPQAEASPNKPTIQSDIRIPIEIETSPVQTPTKDTLLNKFAPQSKEQAAKKIGSVIQKIVSSESVDKGLESRRNSATQSKAVNKPAAFRTEIQKFVNAPDSGMQNANKSQRTEVTFPVAAAGSQERIIPIKLTEEYSNGADTLSRNSSGTTNASRSNLQRMDSAKTSSHSFSRQNSSDTESSLCTAPPRNEHLQKSPRTREFIIPIKMESGHVVTPKEEILNSESSITDDDFRLDSRLRSGRFGRQKRFNSILSDSSDADDKRDSASAASSRRSSATPASHARSLSQGDEPQTPSTPGGAFKAFKQRGSLLPLDRSDSCSSADEDEEDAFEVLTAESLFSSLLDRVRNLTKRLNRESSAGPSWGAESPVSGIWGNNSPLQEFMTRAPSEVRHFMSPTPGTHSTVRTFSREPSVTVTISGGPGWRQSLSREVSGDSEGSEAQSMSGSLNQGRNYSALRNPRTSESENLRALPSHLYSRGQSQSPYNSQFSEPGTPSTAYTPTSRPSYGRTMSNTDYASHSTLPLRRPIRTYDRSYTDRELGASGMGAPFNTSSSHTSNSYSSEPRYLRSSSVVSPNLTNSSQSPSLLRYRAYSRASSTPDPEAKYSSGFNPTEIPPQGINNSPLETNGWLGGATSTSTKTAAASRPPLTTQEKMNNYQNYYQNLNKYPARRLEVLNPAANPNLSRPATMYETSFVDNNSISMDRNKNEIFPAGNPVRESLYTLGRYPKNSPSIIPNHAYSPAPELGTQKDLTLQSRNLNSNGTNFVTPVPAPTTSSSFVTRLQQRDASPSPYIGYSRREPIKPRPASISSNLNEQSLENHQTPQSQPVNQSTPWVMPADKPVLPSPELTNSSVPFSRPLSPRSDMSFVKSESIRLTSPPPLDNENRSQAQPPTPKLKRDMRATSVEKITRFLERKSKPRETAPPEVKPLSSTHQVETETPNPVKTVDTRCSVSPEKQNRPNNKTLKPKFIQSLEKKWGKFTNKTEESVPSSTPTPTDTPELEPTVSDNSDESLNSPNESILLQRAISPEKKPKSKFGATTVNFMLGKFRKMEEGTPPTNAPCGKPPIGIPSFLGRRTQPYAGARSDSVLIQTAVSRSQPSPGPQPPKPVESTLRVVEKPKPEPAVNSDVPTFNKVRCTTPQAEPQAFTRELSEQPESKKVVRRPLSLGIFSSNGDMSKSTSFIPRLQRVNAGSENISGLSELSMDTSPYIAKADLNADENPTTPTSDSFDSASVCSEKTDLSMKSSALDDEESVSQRILHKSFYSRFNSLDRKKPPVSSSSVSVNRHNSASAVRSATTCGTNYLSSNHESSPFSPRINKYNPNPLFKELITDEFKMASAKKNEYSRRVTSKLSKLLSEIDTDIKPCNSNPECAGTSKEFVNDFKTDK